MAESRAAARGLIMVELLAYARDVVKTVEAITEAKAAEKNARAAKAIAYREYRFALTAAIKSGVSPEDG